MKSDYIQIKISPKDKEKLKRLAGENEQTMSEYVRSLIFKEFILREKK